MMRMATIIAVLVTTSAVAQAQVPVDCAREAQDYANLVAPKSGGKVVRNSVNGIVVPGPTRDTTSQLARGRNGSTVSGFQRVDQYAPNREAQWIGQERCALRR